METFRAVPGYEGIYEVSVDGTIQRIAGGKGAVPGRHLRPRIGDNGYPYVNLWRNCKGRSLTVHSIVAAAFLGERPPGFEVNHEDGDRTNPKLGNLEYTAQDDNRRHSWNAGLCPVGEHHGSAVLTEATVHSIRVRYKTGENHISIAKSVKFPTRYVKDVLRGKNWFWLQTSGIDLIELAELFQNRYPAERSGKWRLKPCPEIITGSNLNPSYRMTQRTRRYDPIKPEDRQFLMDKFAGLCAYCGNLASTLDHVLAVKLGGRSVRENLLPACQSCNSRKNDRTLENFILSTK
jgi:hypothetical protein